MLNPLRLNHHICGGNFEKEFPLTFHRPPMPPLNPAAENIAGASERDGPGVELPVAIHPRYVHGRLRGQRACFTVHGKQKGCLNTLVPTTLLRRYVIDLACRPKLIRELRMLGIIESVVFPDLVGLAGELRERFLPLPAAP
jgi:hypothetical protein